MKQATLIALTIIITVPGFVSAFPFGGQVNQIRPCFNDAIYANLSGPVGGPYIWVTGSTKTYSFGPPTHAGQWLLGLAGIPYYCTYSIAPILTVPGTAIIMMGSSR